MADLGIFPHLLFAIIKDIRERVFHWLDDKEERWKIVLARLKARLSGIVFLNNEGVGSRYVCEIGEKITEAQDAEESQPILKAWEYRRLMMVSCCDACVSRRGA